MLEVSAIDITVEWGTVHNLTVDDLHTYSVSNGVDELLTHNCGNGKGGVCGTCGASYDGPKPVHEIIPAHVPGQGLETPICTRWQEV